MATALVLLAHHDDEFFLAPLIQDERAAGVSVKVAYLTHGSRFGAETDTRMQESRAALATLGVPDTDVAELGATQGVFDGELIRRARATLDAVTVHYEGQSFERIYLMAWEGGHTDHDAAHMIGATYAARTHAAARRLEFPLYNCHGMPAGRFQTMRLVPGPGPILERRLDPEEAASYRRLFDSYASQRQVLVALVPGIEQALFQRGSYRYRELQGEHDYSKPPHAGACFYEQRFGVSFAAFRAALASEGF